MCVICISKKTEISQKWSKGIKNWKITYSVILNVLSNKTNLILGFTSPLKHIPYFSISIYCHSLFDDGDYNDNSHYGRQRHRCVNQLLKLKNKSLREKCPAIAATTRLWDDSFGLPTINHAHKRCEARWSPRYPVASHQDQENGVCHSFYDVWLAPQSH